ncbi:InlB B-repeat-containing protein [Halanaerobacter jeridensis]|uniref:Bacterial repeat domain-containing protein n=1 Tax=Halanaerobacter jeridensis TaxID=706427 RepID=A0A938XZF9_9FIRM|nr:hypothetical protein [Halanaerobacter jeridensis]MBM7558150.1 hypothetical protein [Halanaerobacter jeridensis]
MSFKKLIVIGLALMLLVGVVGCSDDDSVKKYNLTVEPKTDGTGEVTVEPLKDKYEEGKEVTLTPSGKGEHSFDHWEGSGYDGNTDNSLTVEMTNDITLVAVFKDSVAPSSPTIEDISTGTYNSNQTFTISGETGATIEYSKDGGTSWTEYSSEVTLSKEKTHNLVARQTDDAGNTSSNTDAMKITIDKTAPNWTTEPNITTTADASSVGISSQVDEEGTIYYKVISDGVTKPTASEVKSAGNSNSISADTIKEITIDSLNAGTEYDIFFVAEDSAGNLQSESRVKKVEKVGESGVVINFQIGGGGIGVQSVNTKAEDKIIITEVELIIYEESDYDINGKNAKVVKNKTKTGSSLSDIGGIGLYLPSNNNYTLVAKLSGTINGKVESGIYQGTTETGILEAGATKSITMEVSLN